jgi:hypothetical protein
VAAQRDDRHWPPKRLVSHGPDNHAQGQLPPATHPVGGAATCGESTG